MKVGVSVEVGFHSGLESITADRCRAELSWQSVGTCNSFTSFEVKKLNVKVARLHIGLDVP